MWINLLVALSLLCGCADRHDADPPGDGPRIVVLSPALAVVLCDLGLEGRIVGRHAYDMVLDDSLPVCGDQQAVNYEALVRTEPTHVLTEWGAREPPGRLADLAADNGWTVRDFRMLTLGDIAQSARDLEAMFGAGPEAGRAERLGALARGPNPAPRWPGRVLLLMGTSPISALGPGCAHHELLERVGAVPAIREGSPAMLLHAEDVVRLAPDAIILIQPRGMQASAAPPTAADLRDRLGVIASLDIPAVREARLALIDHPLALLPSTALADVAEEFERLLARWAGE